MGRSVSGVSFLILVIVVVIVLLLAAKAWQSVMPSATGAIKPDPTASRSEPRQIEGGESLRSGKLPDLKEMGDQTDEHVREVEEAAEAANQ